MDHLDLHALWDRALTASVVKARQTTRQEQLYLQIRRWYARDKGETTLREILALLPSGELSVPDETAPLPSSPG